MLRADHRPQTAGGGEIGMHDSNDVSYLRALNELRSVKTGSVRYASIRPSS